MSVGQADSTFRPLDNHRYGISSAEAERRDSVASSGLFQCVKQGHEYARSARADGMSQRDRAAVLIDAAVFQAEPPLAGERLYGECFIQFDVVDLLDVQSGTVEGLANGVDWGDEEILGRRSGGRR